LTRLNRLSPDLNSQSSEALESGWNTARADWMKRSLRFLPRSFVLSRGSMIAALALRATTGRALMHTPLPHRTEGDNPKRAAFVNQLVRERRIFGGARGPNLKVIRA